LLVLVTEVAIGVLCPSRLPVPNPATDRP